MTEVAAATAPVRRDLLGHALRLEYFTVGWNVVEGVVAIAAAAAAGSVALLGFGIDSFVESASGIILVWRLRAEGSGGDHERIEALERRALKLVALSLFLLAAFVVVKAALSLWQQERPEVSIVGMAVTATSIGVMWWLARAKRITARALGSRALEADSFQTTACWWISIIVLVGIGLNALFDWSWVDPVAAIGMTYFIVREAREAWEGEECVDLYGAAS